MAVIVFPKFSGVAPVLNPSRLPPGMAQDATDVDLLARTLRPWKGLLDVQTGLGTTEPCSIYRFGLTLTSDTQYWMTWQGYDVDAVKAPIVADATERTLYTGNGAPKWTNSTLALTGGPPYPQAYRDLGVQSPAAAPNVVVTGTGSGTAESRAYVYTNVTQYGEESAPSPASSVVSVQSGQTVTIDGFSAAPGGNGSTTARRIYRGIANQDVFNYFFVKEIANAVTSTTDDVGENIGEALITQGWLVPPSDMAGITVMANGICVGFSGYDVCVSEQGVPYAWPYEYRKAADFPIVNCKALGNSTVVGTKGFPYLLSGAAPDQLVLTKIEVPEPCVSKRSMVSMGGYVAYASQHGLIGIDGGGGVRNLTEGLFSRKEWTTLVPSSIRGYLYNGRYIGFYNTGSVTAGFVFEPRQGDAAWTWLSAYALAGHTDLAQDNLYLQVSTKIQKFDASGSYNNYVWRSGVTTMVRPVAIRSGIVFAATYPVTLKLYADGALVHTETVAGKNIFRIGMNDEKREFEVQLEGANEIEKVILASSVSEIKSLLGGS